MSAQARHSLSRRLAMRSGIATAALAMAASLLTVALTAVFQFHSAIISAESTTELVRDTISFGGPSHATQLALDDNTQPYDPHIWIWTGNIVLMQSPNTNNKLPTGPLRTSLIMGRQPRIRILAQREVYTVLLDWPLTPTFDILRDLLIAVVTAGLVSAVIGWFIGNFSARRMLRPVHALTRAAADLRRSRSGLTLPTLSSANDEIGTLGTVLNELLSDLEARRRADRNLLAEAAHQLRTPLQVVRGNAGLLAEQNDLSEQELRDCVAAIQSAVERMIRLTNDLLALESARGSRLEESVIHLRSWLEQVAQDAQAVAPQLQVTVHECAVDEVRCDRQLLEQAFWPLVENALRYSNQGGAVQLGVRALDDGWAIYVRDFGPGIDAADLPHVTERFYRGHQAKTMAGTGLGLAIAQAVTEALGARLDLSTPAGGGTEAAIVLPRQPGPSQKRG